ncbi:uncharacterized protein LOC112602260, partial [Melanaphis sacchari]|uniref:uncharacterized protein LOC112602260 n=1 Tax=Melanaphis sacchari TaxID=742174 RepID=UPI000DC15A43
EWPSEITCVIAGSAWGSSYKFNIAELPAGCDIFVIGQYAFDRDNGIDVHTTKENNDIIKSLHEANKIVYLILGFVNKTDWPSIFAPKDEEQYKKEKMGPLISFLNDFNISGLLMNIRKIYVSFDFTITNKELDIYLIDIQKLNDFCDSDVKKYGMTPIKSPTPNMTSMEQVTSAVTGSTMDKLKIYAMLKCHVRIPNGQPKINNKLITSYSTYCSTNTPQSSLWCQDRSQFSFDQGAFAKKNYKGIVINILDGDDFNSSCGCGLFPVTNAMISGWKSTPLTPCPRLD